MLKPKNKGFSLVESLAAIVIITFVFTGMLTIIINTQRQTVATNARIQAVEIAGKIRDDINEAYDYQSLLDVVDAGDYILNNQNCGVFPVGDACSLFTYQANDKIYDDNVTIVFLAQTPEDATYRMIRFEITVMYYEPRTIMVEGVVYE